MKCVSENTYLKSALRLPTLFNSRDMKMKKLYIFIENHCTLVRKVLGFNIFKYHSPLDCTHQNVLCPTIVAFKKHRMQEVNKKQFWLILINIYDRSK